MTLKDPEGDLEQRLISEFLRVRGYDAAALAALDDLDRQALLAEARRHATRRLAEVEARAHYVHAIHRPT